MFFNLKAIIVYILYLRIYIDNTFGWIPNRNYFNVYLAIGSAAEKAEFYFQVCTDRNGGNRIFDFFSTYLSYP